MDSDNKKIDELQKRIDELEQKNKIIVKKQKLMVVLVDELVLRGAYHGGNFIRSERTDKQLISIFKKLKKIIIAFFSISN